MADIGIGIIGGGYMGKAHAVAMRAVDAVFATNLRPRLVMVAGSTPETAERYRRDYGFERATDDWRELCEDSEVEAVIIASPQALHHEMAEAAIEVGKHVLCEKPLADTFEAAVSMTEKAEKAGIVHMTGFNYIRTPASQFARKLVQTGEIGRVTSFRGEHTEDFLAEIPEAPADRRTSGVGTGAMGDLAPHIINCALAFMGPIKSVMAEVETVHATRMTNGLPVAVSNDDQAHILCRFASGQLGQLFVSRIATGRKMGYAYQIDGTEGAIRFDQEDQNALWLYRAEGDAAERGFKKILTGPAHPDFLPFCQGPGHGTGYQDQIIIEAREFLDAIDSGEPVWPSFRDGLEVARIAEAALLSSAEKRWIEVDTIGAGP